MKISRTKAVSLLTVALLAGAGVVGCSREGGQGTKATAAKPLYHCPMHPTYVSDRPGQCPICKMDLVPMPDAATPPAGGAGGQAASGRKVLYYRSPMDPRVHSPVPRKDEMGMDYVPVYEDEAGGPVVSGRAMVALSPERRQMLGVRSEPVTRQKLERTIRSAGRVAVDERRVHHVHTKYEAYVEQLHVNFVGQYVRRGEHLAAVYSPELVATQQEYLLALRAQKRLQASGLTAVARGGSDLLEAARQRLLFWDVRPEDIARLERTGKVERTVDLHAESSGFVTQKAAIHGMRVTPADILFDIADLSQVWVLAEVYESDLGTVKVGMPAEITLPYQPGRTWRGPVTYVDPLVDPATRTIKVRVEVANEDNALKPDAFADVLLKSDLGQALFVPESAVLRTGDRRLVFLDRGDGRLEPREITTGERAEGGFAVLSGLSEGDRVVTSANFLIDSESSLKAALSAMGAGNVSPAASPEPAAGHVRGSAAGAGPTTPRAPTSSVVARPVADPPSSAAARVPRPARTGPAAGLKPDERPKPEPKTVWYCPMDTEVVSDRPGSCPKCGMDLVPRPTAAAPSDPPHRH